MYHQPYIGRLGDRTILLEHLNGEKLKAVWDTVGATECATSELKRGLIQMAEAHLSMADDAFRLAQARGWYQVPGGQPQMAQQFIGNLQGQQPQPWLS